MKVSILLIFQSPEVQRGFSTSKFSNLTNIVVSVIIIVFPLNLVIRVSFAFLASKVIIVTEFVLSLDGTSMCISRYIWHCLNGMGDKKNVPKKF